MLTGTWLLDLRHQRYLLAIEHNEHLCTIEFPLRLIRLDQLAETSERHSELVTVRVYRLEDIH